LTSLLARRSTSFLKAAAATTSRTHLSVSAAAAFSTQTRTQVETVEGMLQGGWAPIKSNMKEIRMLMDEHKMNHAVKTPDAEFDKEVAEKLGEITNVIKDFPDPAPANMDAVDAQVFGLKKMLKQKLYS